MWVSDDATRGWPVVLFSLCCLTPFSQHISLCFNSSLNTLLTLLRTQPTSSSSGSSVCTTISSIAMAEMMVYQRCIPSSDPGWCSSHHPTPGPPPNTRSPFANQSIFFLSRVMIIYFSNIRWTWMLHI